MTYFRAQKITKEDLSNLSTTVNHSDIRVDIIRHELTFSGKEDCKMEGEVASAHKEAIYKLVGKISNREKIDAILNLKLNCEFNTRFKTRAGDACSRTGNIRLHYALHKDNNDQLLETYLHELAHILNKILYPHHRKSHGWEWEAVMYLLDRKPEVRHTMDVKKFRRKRTRYVYKCECSDKNEFNLTPQKHKTNEIALAWKKNADIGGPRFSCRVCKKSLVFTGKVLKL